MIGRLTRSLAQLVLAIFALATITFFLLRLLPGGPFDRAVPYRSEQRQAIEARYGLEQPLLRQYSRWLGQVTRLDFGTSFRFEGQPVSEILRQGAPVSFTLGGFAMLLALLVGIPIGVESARRRGQLFDIFARILAAGLVSLPAYLAGALLLYWLSLRWELFPAAFWGGPSHWILPVITLSLAPTAHVARLVRASVLETTQADFVRTARAKGLSEASVFWRHAFRNALLPLITLAGPLAVNLVAGTFVVEMLFALPGLGQRFVNSVSTRDYPLVMALTLGYGTFLVAMNLLVDAAYSWADPRWRRP